MEGLFFRKKVPIFPRASMNNSSTISLYELRGLLVLLRDEKPDVSIRLRLSGQLWWERFAKVIFIEGNKAIFNDEASVKLIIVSSLADVMEFEIDQPCQNLQPHFHYNLIPFS